MATKKGLGRGLGAILSKDTGSAGAADNTKSTAGTGRKKDISSGANVSRETSAIKLSMIEPNLSQPRKNFDEQSLRELADSIKAHGVLQPIIVKKKGRMYEIVVGERRWRASKMAGLKEIPAMVRDMDDREAAEAALIENIQREDLGSVEEARAYKALKDEYGLTQEEIALRVSKSRTAIANSLRLLQLDERVLKMLESGELTAGHARAILGISGKANQYKAALEAAGGALSVRQTEKLAKAYSSAKPKKTKSASVKAEEEERAAYIRAAETGLTEAMNTKVSIRQTGKSRGRIEIEYYSDEELNDIIEKLGGSI